MSLRGRLGKHGDMKRRDRLRNAEIRPLPRQRATGEGGPPSFESGRISIRKARPLDRGFISRLSEEAFSVYGPYGDLVPAWFESGLPLTFTAVEKKSPIGFAMFGRLLEGPEEDSSFELLAIAVNPSAHRRGVGDLLLRRVEKEAAKLGVSALRLHTATDNLPALELFNKHHFIPLSIKRRFYSEGQDAVMMVKFL